jgi:hypothetical protein
MDCRTKSEALANAGRPGGRIGGDSGSERAAFRITKAKACDKVVNEEESGAD